MYGTLLCDAMSTELQVNALTTHPLNSTLLYIEKPLFRAVKELFLEQMRVIDSHPYENVGDDGQPLLDADNRQDVMIRNYKHMVKKSLK